MYIKRYYILLIFTLLLSGISYSQENRTEIRVDFRVNSTVLEKDYNNNAKRISEIISFLQQIEQDSTLTIKEISFCGSASPEGSYQLNNKLARGRLKTLEEIVRKEVSIPDSIITRDDSYISWEELKHQVELSDLPYKDSILSIINQPPHLVDYPGNRHIDHRIVSLQSIERGRIWRMLNERYFELMRNAYAVFITYKSATLPPIEEILLPSPEVVDTITDTVKSPQIEIVPLYHRNLYLKTNALGLGLAIANIAAEVDLTQHWSVTLPIYYSALNYFTRTIKFRTFAVQPEVRYWLNENNQGFFGGVHFGLIQYNVAVDGDYRYQDRNGKSPSLGGGISIGYRNPISANGKWHIEYTIGAGVYSMHYDKFHNITNGKLIETKKKTYFGLDQASVSFIYTIDISKKGGKR